MANRTWISYLPNAFGYSGSSRSDIGILCTKSGYSVPNFRQKIAAGIDASSPYDLEVLSHIEEKPINGVYQRELSLNGQLFSYDEYPMIGHPLNVAAYGDALYKHGITVSVTNEDEAQALSRLYGKLREQQQQFNSLQFLGELKETIHLLKHPFEAFTKATQAYTKSLKSTRRRANLELKQRKGETWDQFVARRLNWVKNAMSGSWLAYSFGARPIVSDTEDILDVIDAYLGERRSNTKVSGKSASKPIYVDLITAGDFTPYSDSLWISQTASALSDTSVRYVCGIRSSVTGPDRSVGNLKERLGFRIENFLPTLYELAPWSFMIDYIVNVGTILDAACTDTSDIFYTTRTTRSSTTTLIRSEVKFVDSWPGEVFHGAFVGNPVSFRKHRYTVLKREVMAKPPLPPIVFTIAGTLENAGKVANTVALITQAKDFRFR